MAGSGADGGVGVDGCAEPPQPAVEDSEQALEGGVSPAPPPQPASAAAVSSMHALIS